MSRQIDDEDATRARQVSHVETASVRDNSPLAVGQSQTEAGAVGATLLERMKQFSALSLRQPAALVLHLDANATI